jgi:hypothetical protein
MTNLDERPIPTFIATGLRGIIFLALIIGLVWVNWQFPGRWALLVTAVALIAQLALIGSTINNRPAGILIDNRNRVSLSKLQAVAWTVLMLSGLVAAVGWNLHTGEPNPLGIEIATDLLVAMGISATSFVATPALLSLKAKEEPTERDLLNAAAAQPAKAVGDITNAGKVFGRTSMEDASWVDLFRGDEVSNVDSPDLSKVQQFLVTLILLGVYASALWAQFAGLGAKVITELPKFSDQFVWLMGISHAGYLAYKAAPHGRTAPTEDAILGDPRTEAAG